MNKKAPVFSEGEKGPDEGSPLEEAITKLIEGAVTKPESPEEDRTEEIFGPFKTLDEVAKERKYL